MQVEAIGSYRDNQLITNVIVRSREFDRNPLLAAESVVWMLAVHDKLVELVREFSDKAQKIEGFDGDLLASARGVLSEADCGK